MNSKNPTPSTNFPSLQSIRDSLLDLILFNEIQYPNEVCDYLLLLNINPIVPVRKNKHYCPQDCSFSSSCGTFFFVNTHKLTKILKTHSRAFNTYDLTYLRSLLNYLSLLTEDDLNLESSVMLSLKYYLLNYNPKRISP